MIYPRFSRWKKPNSNIRAREQLNTSPMTAGVPDIKPALNTLPRLKTYMTDPLRDQTLKFLEIVNSWKSLPGSLAKTFYFLFKKNGDPHFFEEKNPIKERR